MSLDICRNHVPRENNATDIRSGTHRYLLARASPRDNDNTARGSLACGLRSQNKHQGCTSRLSLSRNISILLNNCPLNIYIFVSISMNALHYHTLLFYGLSLQLLKIAINFALIENALSKSDIHRYN